MSNVELNLGAGGKVARTETKGGFESQVVLLDLGGLGAESLLTGAMPVTGAFWQATQPVSIASAVPVTGTFWQTTQPVSGAVTANAGTNLNTSALALETGGNLATVATRTPALGQALAAASVPVVLTAAQLTTLTPLTTVAVTGTFWQATQPVSNAGTFPTQATQAGTWNITTLTTLTGITNALPAGTNLLGKVSAAQDTSQLYSGTTALTPKFAFYNTSASGATTVVPLVIGKQLRVLRWRNTSNGTTNVKWQSHVSGDISGLSYCTQFKDVGGGYCPLGHFQTAAGEALDINNSAAVAISGEITYVEV